MTVQEIENKIDSGKTMYITTYLKSIKINKKTLNKWRSAGLALFKDSPCGQGFYIARGRSYDFVIESVTNIQFV